MRSVVARPPAIPRVRGARRKEVRRRAGGRASQAGDCGGIVEDPKAAAVRRDEQVVALRLHAHVVHRHRRHVQPQALPVRAAIEGEPHASFEPGVEHVGILRILAHDVNVLIGGKAGDDASPARAGIVGDEHVGARVAHHVPVDRNVGALRGNVRGFDRIDASPRGDAGRCNVAPVRAPVGRNLQRGRRRCRPRCVRVRAARAQCRRSCRRTPRRRRRY